MPQLHLNKNMNNICNTISNDGTSRLSKTQLDKKILSGLLKGTGMELKHQLYLSMIWDRIDIAEEKIFANGKKY